MLQHQKEELLGPMAHRDSSASPKDTPDWKELRAVIAKKSFSDDESRTLSSGVTTSFYFDMKRTLADPEGGPLVAKLICEELKQLQCDFVGGLEMGAVPIATSVMHSASSERRIPFFWIRKKPKEHGTQALIEGQTASDLEGKNIVIVDDVTTTGNSVLKAVDVVREAGGNVSAVIAVVDRLEGAKAKLSNHGLRFITLFTADDFR